MPHADKKNIVASRIAMPKDFTMVTAPLEF